MALISRPKISDAGEKMSWLVEAKRLTDIFQMLWCTTTRFDLIFHLYILYASSVHIEKWTEFSYCMHLCHGTHLLEDYTLSVREKPNSFSSRGKLCCSITFNNKQVFRKGGVIVDLAFSFHFETIFSQHFNWHLFICCLCTPMMFCLSVLFKKLRRRKDLRKI